MSRWYRRVLLCVCPLPCPGQAASGVIGWLADFRCVSTATDQHNVHTDRRTQRDKNRTLGLQTLYGIDRDGRARMRARPQLWLTLLCADGLYLLCRNLTIAGGKQLTVMINPTFHRLNTQRERRRDREGRRQERSENGDERSAVQCA